MAATITIFAGAILGIEIIAMRRMHRASRRAVPAEPLEPGAYIDAILARAASEITALFDLRACWFEPFPFDVLLPRIEEGRIALPVAEPGLVPWSTAGVELPVHFNGLTLGRFVLVARTPTTGVALAPSARGRAMTIASHVAAPLAAAVVHGDGGRLRALPAAMAPDRSPSEIRTHGHSRT